MTQARDKANIPVLNFASKGIDDNADATAITIDSGEDVGIGNTSPFARLVVQGANNENTMVVNTIGTSPNYIFDVRDDGTSVFRIIGSGNVGIGTTSPARQLTVSGSASPVIAIRDTGTSGSPSLFFGDSGADNVGKIQYNNSNNSLATVVNGSERMRISANGNIGIGTTSSTAAKVLIDHTGDADDNGLYVYSNLGQTVPLFQVIQDGAGSTAPSAYIRNDDVDGIALQLHKGGSSVTPHVNANSLFIEDDNNTGITIATPTNRVGNIFFADSGSNFDGYLQYNHTSRAMIFGTATAERMRIDSSGRLLVGTAAPFSSGNNSSIHINVDGVATAAGAIMSECSGTGTVFHYHLRNGNGGVGGISTNGSATAFVTSSDYRLKENVSYNFDATTRLKQLKPARFNFIADDTKIVDGFIAHEVSSVVPEAISGEKDAVKIWQEGEELPEGVSVGDNKLDENGNTIPDYQGIDQSKLVPLLVKTIQELEARITTLENN